MHAAFSRTDAALVALRSERAGTYQPRVKPGEREAQSFCTLKECSNHNQSSGDYWSAGELLHSKKPGLGFRQAYSLPAL